MRGVELEPGHGTPLTALFRRNFTCFPSLDLSSARCIMSTFSKRLGTLLPIWYCWSLTTCIKANYHQRATAATASQALVGNLSSWAARGGTGLHQGRGVACPWWICLDQGTGASRFSAVWTSGLKYHYSHYLETGRADTRPGPSGGEPALETFLAPVPQDTGIGQNKNASTVSRQVLPGVPQAEGSTEAVSPRCKAHAHPCQSWT